MLRLTAEVSKWSIWQHRHARDLPSMERDDAPIRKLEDEVFDRLYSGELEKAEKLDASAELTAWAEKVHGICSELPNFTRLARECLGDADAAATATEKLMEAMGPHLKQKPDEVQPPQLRRAINGACDDASDAVDQQRETMDGLAGVGFGAGNGEKARVSGHKARRLSQRLREDDRLARIAILAGRFRRMAINKQRSKVKHGADEVCDVELGSNLSRLLPSELAQVAHPLMRLALMARLIEGRVMQYRLSGSDTKGRGPLVVCLDKSGSMDGPKDIWATAVALALLEVAHRQRRPFALVAFDGAVKREDVVEVGGQLPEETLFTACSGGTNITGVLARALSIIQTSTNGMKTADVVLITDGESETQDAPVVRQLAEQLRVTILGVGIGVSAESLKPWCDEAHAISRLDTVDEVAAEALFTI